MSASSSTLRPVTVPSDLAASVSFWIWSRPWCAAIRDSLRVSVYLHGLPSRLAATHGEHLLGRELQLAAESAADVRRDHAELALGDARHERHEVAHDVRDLGRGPDRRSARRSGRPRSSAAP